MKLIISFRRRWRRPRSDSSWKYGGHVAVQHVGGMKLTEQSDHFVLRENVILQAGAGDVPDLLYGALAVIRLMTR